MIDIEDPVLKAHQIKQRQYSICGGLTPFSIRDQMLRACWIVERAFPNESYEGSKDLLIIGAGPAGQRSDSSREESHFCSG